MKIWGLLRCAKVGQIKPKTRNEC